MVGLESQLVTYFVWSFLCYHHVFAPGIYKHMLNVSVYVFLYWTKEIRITYLHDIVSLEWDLSHAQVKWVSRVVLETHRNQLRRALAQCIQMRKGARFERYICR